MADNSSKSNGSSFLSSVLGIFATIFVFAVLVLLASGISSDEPAPTPRAFPDAPSAATLRAQEKETLSSYTWIDQEKGTVRIPVDRAAELVIEELNQ